MRSFATDITIVLVCLSCFACKSEDKATPPPPVQAAQVKETPGKEAEATPVPPGVPVTETFDREPQLSLFARAATHRPADDDSKNLGFWAAYIDHIQRTSGMRPKSGRDKSNGWAIQGIKGVGSVSFFAPLAVKPATRYRVTFDFKGDLPPKTTAGIGVLEFKEFLWVGEQFTEEISKKYQSGSYAGTTLKNKNDWQNHAFDFTTSPQAGMIHLVLYYDGETDRGKPVFFDNISINTAP